MSEKLLEVRNLHTSFFTDEGVIPAVDGVTFSLEKQQTLAIVGESGCGKSVTSLSILRLIQSPGKITEGEILFEGQDLLKKSESEMRRLRGHQISMIFQEPMTSLNPVFTVYTQISESLKYHTNLPKSKYREVALELLERVRIPNPEKVLNDYPHRLSGGMRQRVMIAMSLACDPRILIADEPTTALDVTIQAQILCLLNDLKRETGTAIILITHDLGVVAETADKVMVMSAGEVVEYADTHPLFRQPLHPYTLGLLESIPKINVKADRLYNIKGMIPAPKDYPKGCRFAPRCEHCQTRCFEEKPPLFDMGEGRKVRCWKYEHCKGGDDA